MYKTIKENSTAEIVEKKSKFIANVFYIESQEEANKCIEEIRKKYFDARHNCFAYSVLAEEGIVNRFSDDGEPSGTAGSPMLNILNSNNITNTLVVVTRYFGGILLGTGGLVRAYSDAAKKAIDGIELVDIEKGKEVLIEISYQDVEKLKYYLNKNSISIRDTIYKENVEVYVDIENEKFDELTSNSRELNFQINRIEVIKEKVVRI